MCKYRLPTSAPGWVEINADTPYDAAQALRGNGYLGISLPSLQVWTGSNWDWAQELPPHLGGYNRRDERI